MEEIISWLSGDEKRSPAAKHSTKEGTSEERQKQKQAQGIFGFLLVKLKDYSGIVCHSGLCEHIHQPGD